MIALRSLMFYIQNRKPDVLERMAMEALQTVCRQVFRKTLCWRLDVTGTMVIHQGTLDPVAPAQLVGSDTIPVDVIAVQRLEALNNSVWYALRLNSTLTVENNQNSVDQSGVYMPYALPRKYSELDGLVTFDAAPDQAYPYKARVAVWPTEGSYFESVPIPEDFKMMLVEGAMAILWEFGDTRDPRLADRAGMAYENHLRNFGAHVWTTGGEAKFTKVSLSPYRRR